MIPEPRKIIQLCHDCATQVYGTRAPSHIYAQNVALLLAGTAATESLMQHRRQLGFDHGDMRGAWGLFQTEGAPLKDNIDYLKRRKDVAAKAEAFLYPDGGDITYLLNMDIPDLLHLCASWDRFACLMARIHYMRFPAAVPASNEARAAYYKKYYNTTAGKGSSEKYLRDYKRFIAPYLEAGIQ